MKFCPIFYPLFFMTPATGGYNNYFSFNNIHFYKVFAIHC